MTQPVLPDLLGRDVRIVYVPLVIPLPQEWISQQEFWRKSGRNLDSDLFILDGKIKKDSDIQTHFDQNP